MPSFLQMSRFVSGRLKQIELLEAFRILLCFQSCSFFCAFRMTMIFRQTDHMDREN